MVYVIYNKEDVNDEFTDERYAEQEECQNVNYSDECWDEDDEECDADDEGEFSDDDIECIEQ